MFLSCINKQSYKAIWFRDLERRWSHALGNKWFNNVTVYFERITVSRRSNVCEYPHRGQGALAPTQISVAACDTWVSGCKQPSKSVLRTLSKTKWLFFWGAVKSNGHWKKNPSKPIKLHHILHFWLLSNPFSLPQMLFSSKLTP